MARMTHFRAAISMTTKGWLSTAGIHLHHSPGDQLSELRCQQSHSPSKGDSTGKNHSLPPPSSGGPRCPLAVTRSLHSQPLWSQCHVPVHYIISLCSHVAAYDGTKAQVIQGHLLNSPNLAICKDTFPKTSHFQTLGSPS